MGPWSHVKVNKFTVLRGIQLIPAWGIFILLFTYYDGDCVRWSRRGTHRESCVESANNTLAYYNWIGEYNVYPEIRGQVYVFSSAIFCIITSLGLMITTIKCNRSNNDAPSIPLQSTNEPSTYVAPAPMSSEYVRNFFLASGPRHSNLVKFLLIFCILLMLAAGPLETWYAMGFGRVDIPAFIGSQAQWFGNWAQCAVCCFILAVLYIVDFVLGTRGEANPHLQVTEYR